MVTWAEARGNFGKATYYEGVCLSTDKKPTEGVLNGSKLMEMDTATLYLYDAENQMWRAWK